MALDDVQCIWEAGTTASTCFSVLFRHFSPRWLQNQAVNAQSRLSMNGTDKTPLDDNVPDLLITREMFGQRSKPLKQKEEEDVTNEQADDVSVLSRPEIVALSDQVQKSETDIPDFADVIQNRARDSE